MVKQKYISIKKILQSILLTAAIFLVASGIGYLFHFIGFPDTNIVVIYLLAVLITSWLAQSFIYGFIGIFSIIQKLKLLNIKLKSIQ